jgi:hypothetical protein
VAKALDGNGLSCPVGSQEIIDPETVKRFGIVVRDWASTDCLEKSLFKALNII